MHQFLKIAAFYLISISAFGQTIFYHVDSVDRHWRPIDDARNSQCIAFKDTSKIEMHTWYYYEPGMIISDSSFFTNGRLITVQQLIGDSTTKINLAALSYQGDTVLVRYNYRKYITSYSAIKMSAFDSIFMKSDMRQFGWSVMKNLSGKSIDSVYFEDGQMQIVKQYYPNGKLERHEFVENGEIRCLRYKENGRKMRLLKNHRWPPRYLHYLDSVDVQYYDQNNKPHSICQVEQDTSIIKMSTWIFVHRHQLITDSVYYVNGAQIRQQKLVYYWPERIVTDQFNYHEDTLLHTSYRGSSTRYSQYIKTIDYEDSTDWNSVLGHLEDYKLYGWSVTIHDEGYVMDSTFYENDQRMMSKSFYKTGKLKSHEYRTPDGIVAKEYKQNGKIRRRIRRSWFNENYAYLSTAAMLIMLSIIP